MNIDIDKLTEEQLCDLNHRVVARLKMLRELRAHTQMMKLSIGERVSFSPDGRPRQTGIVTRYNRKSVTFITDGGERWNVSPSLLERIRKAENAKADDGPTLRIANQ